MPRKILILLILVVLIATIAYFALRREPTDLILTGVVAADDIVVSSQVTGQVDRMLVAEGDSVKKGQLLATLEPAELQADQTYYAHSADALDAQISAASANLAAASADNAKAIDTLANDRRTWERDAEIAKTGVISQQQLDDARTSYDVARSQADAAGKQVAAARSSLASVRQQRDAAVAQASKAGVRVGYTEVRAPIDGVVDVRAAQIGEVIPSGQAIVTLIDPDALWVRADVEESYIDRVRIGDKLTVRLPSGALRTGVVYFRGVDAGFATQRDVSRTKRDVKTFEIKLRVDNRDRRLAVGMTVYVLLPLETASS